MFAKRRASYRFLLMILAAGMRLPAQKLNDLTVYPALPAPTLPPAGGTYQDPTFGTTVLRVTDANDGQMNMPLYSSIYPAFNADSSRITYITGNGLNMIADLDVPNRRVSNKRAMPTTPNGIAGVFYWHRTDPDKFFVFVGPILWEYSFQAAQYTQVVDFSTLIPGVAYVGSRGMSDDCNRFEVDFANASYQSIPSAQGIFIYDRTRNALVYNLTPDRAGGQTKGQMDASGRYVLTINYFADSVTNQVSNIVAEGHFDANFGMVATYLGNGNGWYPGYRLLNPNGAGYLTANLIGPQGPWADDAHFGLADSNGEWLTGSYEDDDYTELQDAAGNRMSTPGWKWSWDSQPPNARGHWTWTAQGLQPSQTPFPLDVVYEGEVFQTSVRVPPLSVVQQWNQAAQDAVPVGPVTLPNGRTYATWADFQANENINTVLSANPVNRRICKHYSDPKISANSGIGYWAQPHAIGSPDNRVVMFGSNFGDPNRVDVFIAFIDTIASTCSYALSPTSVSAGAAASSGTLTVTPSSPTCSAVTASSNVSWASVSVSGNTVNWSVTANSGSGSRSGSLRVAGQTVVITQAGTVATVTMTLFPSSLTWGTNGALMTAPQSASLTFAGGAPGWTATASQPNITVSPTSGVGNGSLQISVTAGPSGVVTVNAPGVANSPQVIQVQINSATVTAPFGSFDTPVNNARGVSAAIAVTGWALDSIGVNKVDIWREPVGPEPPGLIYIGDAVFVPGARPDVARSFSSYPNSNGAGWGYLLLTNFLPNANGARGSGNGMYTLHALAHNRAGAVADLGARAITVDNTDATLPFGSIDTPAQGASVWGNAYVNFGWAVTPMPALIPTDGTTITANVDGVTIGHPTYNQFRGDIATLFPGFANSNGAIGFIYIDTTKLPNGLHTISWDVWDNEIRGNGVGSRFFYVLNSVDATTSDPPASSGSESSITSLQDRHSSQAANRLAPVANDVLSMEVEEMDRIELPLGATSGYMVANGEMQPLPVGSTLQDGVFYWQLAPVFLGEYDLVFERPGAAPTHLRVIVRPKSYSAGEHEAVQ